jgi:hypothetical protein
MVLLGCEVLFEGEPGLVAEAIDRSMTLEELERRVPGLSDAVVQAMRDLSSRRLVATRLQFKGRTVRALPAKEYDMEDTCVPLNCPCGKMHDPNLGSISPRSPRFSF